MAWLIFRAIGSGVPLGRKNAFQVLALTSNPCSTAVGTSGKAAERTSFSTAIALMVPPSIYGVAVDDVAEVIDAAAGEILHRRIGATIRDMDDINPVTEFIRA